jgi:hypothetical protein
VASIVPKRITIITVTILRRLPLKIVLDVVKESKVFILFLVLSILSFSCYTPTDEDRAKLKELENQFGDRYKFSLDKNGPYLYAKLKKDAVIHKDDDEVIYKLFRFKNFEKKEERDSTYVYLNLYDAKGNFIHQIYYDPKIHEFRREYKREHY